MIYQHGENLLTSRLYPPVNINEVIDLKAAEINTIAVSTVYSSDKKVSFSNETNQIIFRKENPAVGNWRIDMGVKMRVADRIELWLSQEELNQHIRLNPSTPALTMGSIACIPNVMSIGEYDFNSDTMNASLGCGNENSLNVVPRFVTYGRNILALCLSNSWVSIAGTVPAASIIAGAASPIYQKHIETRRKTLPNTITMTSLITTYLSQINTIEYPNLKATFYNI